MRKLLLAIILAIIPSAVFAAANPANVLAVPSMAVLSSYPAIVMQQYGTFQLNGYYAGSTAGGGTFTWLTAAQASGLTPDGGVVIAPSDHPADCSQGCLLRQTTNQPFSPTWFGAYGDGKKVTDASISASSSSLCSSSYTFSSKDVGKIVNVAGAGTTGAVLVANISSVSSGCAALSTPASTAVTGAVAQFAHDDGAAIIATIASASRLKTSIDIDSGSTFGYAEQITGSTTGGQEISFVGGGTFLFLSPQLLNSAASGYIPETMLFTMTPTDKFLWNGPTVDQGLFYGGTVAAYPNDFPGIIGSSFYNTPVPIPTDFNYGVMRVSGAGLVRIQNQHLLNIVRGVLIDGTSGTQRTDVNNSNNDCESGTSYLVECYLGYNVGLWKHTEIVANGISFEDSRSDGGQVTSAGALWAQRENSVLYSNITGHGVQLGAVGGLQQDITVSSISVSGTTATVTTSAPHDLENGSYVYFYCVVPAYFSNNLFQVTVTGSTTFTVTVPSATSNGSACAVPGTMFAHEAAPLGSMENITMDVPPADTALSAFWRASDDHVSIRHSGDVGEQFDDSVFVTTSNLNCDGVLSSCIAGYDMGYVTITNANLKDVAQTYVIGGRSPSSTVSRGISFLLGSLGRTLNMLNIDNVTGTQLNTPDTNRIGEFISGGAVLSANCSGSPPACANFPGTINNISVTSDSSIPFFVTSIPDAIVSITSSSGVPVVGELCTGGTSGVKARYVSNTPAILWVANESGPFTSGGETVTCPSGATFAVTGATTRTGMILGPNLTDYQRSQVNTPVP